MGLEIKSKVSGRYKIEAIKLDKDGNEVSRRLAADWFDNLITTPGLNYMGNSDGWMTYCQVGTSSAAPAFTDTSLGAFLAYTSTLTANTSGISGATPYYTWAAKTFRFAEGVAAGNLSEVGVGWTTNAGVYSRALILDGVGAPTTITILSDETLDVTYEFRFYPQLTDDTGTIVFTGNIGGSYDFIFRAAMVGAVGGYWGMPPIGMGYTGAYYVKDGDIAAVTSQPSGNSSTLTVAAQSYVDASLERKFNASLSLTQGNLAGGIRCFSSILGLGFFQLQFDPAIPKTSNDLVTFVIKHSWGRV